MREIRTYGSEGGAAGKLAVPTPIPVGARFSNRGTISTGIVVLRRPRPCAPTKHAAPLLLWRRRELFSLLKHRGHP